MFGKSVADVYSMTLGIRVCLQFQKVSLQNRSYLFKKKIIVVKSRKNCILQLFFQHLIHVFFLLLPLISWDWFTLAFKLSLKTSVEEKHLWIQSNFPHVSEKPRAH